MFRLGSRKQEATFPFPISVDIHSHILPGIDDGSPDVDTSIKLVNGMMALGIHTAVATPHIHSSRYRNTKETIEAAHVLLQSEIQNRRLDFALHYAAEYLLDDIFFEGLKKGEEMLCVCDKRILTEFSFAAPPFSAKQMAYELLMAGYEPILAHPERYRYFHNDYKIYHTLTDLGFQLQVNVLSVAGFYGPDVAKAARYIIKNNLVSYTGTDLHGDLGLTALQNLNNKELMHDAFAALQLNKNILQP